MDHTEVVTAIHQSPSRLVLALTGGGSGLISTLLTTPGASQTVLECIVPYTAVSLSDWLGIVPDRNCSADTALQMAAQAHRRALQLVDRSEGATTKGREKILGVGLTAALTTNRERLGDERAYLAIHSLNSTRLTTVHFTKGTWSRAEQETYLTELCLEQIADACGIWDASNELFEKVTFAAPNVTQNTKVSLPPDVSVREVVERRRDWVMRSKLGVWTTGKVLPVGLLSGSFRPLHAAHLKLAEVASELLGGAVAFELPLLNADKPPVDYCSLEERLQTLGNQILILTTAPTFVEKSQLFPRMTFVVGADTAARVCDRRFYNNSTEEMHQALSTISNRGCSFLVAARRLHGQVTTVDDLSIPEAHQSLFRAIPKEVFLWDLSSTEIRRRCDA